MARISYKKMGPYLFNRFIGFPRLTIGFNFFANTVGMGSSSIIEDVIYNSLAIKLSTKCRAYEHLFFYFIKELHVQNKLLA